MSKFKYGDKVEHLGKLSVVVDCEIDGHYKILPHGEYEWIFATEDLLQPVSDWVSCLDRLPDTYTYVLVLTKTGNKPQIFVDELYKSTKYGALWQNNDNLVTHWMPLPKLPDS